MLIFVDTEFTDFVQIDLISIAPVTDNGREFYAERTDYRHDDYKAFVRAAVIPARAGPEDGRTLAHDILELVSGLYAMGVTTDNVHCGDWREGDHILMSGQQIGLKVALRRMAGQYHGWPP